MTDAPQRRVAWSDPPMAGSLRASVAVGRSASSKRRAACSSNRDRLGRRDDTRRRRRPPQPTVINGDSTVKGGHFIHLLPTRVRSPVELMRLAMDKTVRGGDASDDLV